MTVCVPTSGKTVPTVNIAAFLKYGGIILLLLPQANAEENLNIYNFNIKFYYVIKMF